MKKYVIERPIPGVGSLTRDELHAASTRSCVALDELGPDIQWVHSYVTDDKIYCVYLAANEQLIREHARARAISRGEDFRRARNDRSHDADRDVPAAVA